MVNIDPVQGVGATPPAGKLEKAPENKTLAGYLAMIMLFEAILDGVYIPHVKNSALISQAAKAIFEFLSKDKKGYMHDIDKLLTQFLNGFGYLKKLAKEGKLPPGVKKFLDNKTFEKLYKKAKQMAKIEKEHPNTYKHNPQWKKDEKSIIGKGGLLDQLHEYGKKHPSFVAAAQTFASLSTDASQTLLHLATMELKKWDSVIKQATTYLGRKHSIANFIDSAILR